MKNKLIVLTGPTAAGKTDLSIKLAKKIDGEIISADSVQVYKGFDIGSAKITPDEMQGVPHHMIDVYEPDFPFDVTVFQKDAKRLVNEIYERGHIPIIVGGTAFYIQALLYDVDFDTENEDKAYRKELEDYLEKTGDIDSLYEKLKEIDPASAEIIHKNNHRKVIRALEYFHYHNKPISEHNAEQHTKESVYDSRYYVITMNRDRLYSRINKRVDIMREQGLYEEVKGLLNNGVKREYNSMQAIGYKEIYDAIQLIKENNIKEGSADYNEILEKAYDDIKQNTRHFAKRQLTWFRREKDVIWLDRDEFSNDYSLSSEETDERMLERIQNG